MAEIERNCWQCAHMRMQMAEADWSEVTPGNAFGLECLKDRWRFSSYDTTEREARVMFQTATTCPDFDHLDTTDRIGR